MIQMLKRLAYLIVLNDLRKLNMFNGIYDGKYGNHSFMIGIETVMTEIAYNAGDKYGRRFMDKFINNLISSEEKENGSDE